MPREAFEPEARKRVTLGLIVAELVRREGLAAKPEQIKAVVQEYAESYERPEEVVRWYYQSPDRLREVESLVLENNVVDWVLSRRQGRGQADRFRRTDGERANDVGTSRGLEPSAPGPHPDGHRAERPRRARLRHLLAPAQGARGVPGRRR